MSTEDIPPSAHWLALCAELDRRAMKSNKEVELIPSARAALAQPEPEVVGPDVEELAQLIYEQAMIPAARYCKTEVPAWAERGNSFAQDDARDCARAVLARWGGHTSQEVLE